MTLSRTLAALFVALTANAGASQDWRYAIGVHDFAVPDVGSHTYGVNGRMSMNMRTESGRHYFGTLELLLDHDKDHLDSDHIPLWLQFHLGTDGDFWRSGPLRLGWTADIENRMNTVSAIEVNVTALPALVGSYETPNFQASLEAGAGWFYLEIDDDAPRERGYDRSTLPNSTVAYAATAKFKVRMGEAWTLTGRARGWWDRYGALVSHYQAALRMDISSWMGDGSMKQPALVLSADSYKYNLDVYNRPNAPPILRWNDDLMIKLSFETKW